MINSLIAERFTDIILASASPRRAELLKQIGLNFQVCPSDLLETVATRTAPAEAVEKLALRKAQTVGRRFKRGLVIGADTVVAINREIIGKPENNRHAVEILSQLSGTHHEVVTGVSLLDLEKERQIVWSERTLVYFRKLHESEILEYVCSHDVSDKAGAYGIQEKAAAFVSRIEGCYFNVVGLPLASLVEKLWGLSES